MPPYLYIVGKTLVKDLAWDGITVELAIVPCLLAGTIHNLPGVSSETSGGLSIRQRETELQYRTYDANVPVNISDTVIGSLHQKLIENHLLNAQHDAIFAANSNSSAWLM